MANSTIYNYRFYALQHQLVTEADYNWIFEKLFMQDDYRNGKLTSYTVPMIYEMSEHKEFIELLIEPYKNVEFTWHMDVIIESNAYDIWIRSMSDSSYIDCISLNNQYHRICKYQYDKIVITTNDNFDKPDLYSLDIVGDKNQTFDYKFSGQYHAGITIGRETEGGYFEFKNRLNLKDKLNLQIGEYGKITDCSEWYSDDKVYFFMKYLKYKKGFEKIEFFFNNRTTRLYDNHDMGECYMVDDWDNCIDEEFLKFRTNRK